VPLAGVASIGWLTISDTCPLQALRVLYRVANDPGIVAIMESHRWNVGLLSEMPPEGKVGVSEVCVLGYNVVSVFTIN
jgi:hypothetical protein